MRGVPDDLTFLFQSESRLPVLLDVAEDAPLDRYDLEERLDVSRRTVIRTLEALADRGYVTEAETGFTATALGNAVADASADLIDSMHDFDRLAPFLQRVPADALDLDPALLADAEVVTSSDATPYAALDRVLQLRAESETIRELSTIAERKSLAQMADRVERGDPFDVEVVVAESVLQSAASNPAYGPLQDRLLGAENVEIRVHDDVPMLLAVLDGERVALGVSEQRLPAVCVVSDHPEVVEWAEATYDRLRAEARRPEPP